MEFNPYSLPLIISFSAILTIGFLGYRYNSTSPINKSLFYFCLSCSFWLLNFFIMYNCRSASNALFWCKIGFIGVLLIPISGYFFVHQLLFINPVPHIKKLLAFALLSFSLLGTNLIYTNVKTETWGFYPIAGKIYFLYVLLFGGLIFVCIFKLFKKMQEIPKNTSQYKEIKYVLFSFFMVLTGVVDFLAKYFHHIYPFAWLSALLFICTITYAVVRHQIYENEFLREEVAKTERFKAVATLASSVVHEIRNPLTAISTFTEYIPQKKHDPVFLEQFVQTVPAEINRINALMQELLAFAKPSEPKLELIDPTSLIENLIKLLSPQITKAHIQIQLNLTDIPVQIQADLGQVKQALLNILINAIDAMPNGGTLSVTFITSEASQHVIPAKAGIQIEISDTGCGIDPKHLPHIFEPFFTKKEKGTGLGLAITQGIVEKHGGKISVKSQKGQGTTFTISLQLKKG